MTEVFFAWWACLYRPQGIPTSRRSLRSLKGPMALTSIDLVALDKALPSGTPALSTADAALARLLPSNTQLVVTLDAGVERLAVLALGPRLQEQGYGAPEYELAGTSRLRRCDRSEERPPGRAAAERRDYRSAHHARQPRARWRNGSTRNCLAAVGTRCIPAWCW